VAIYTHLRDNGELELAEPEHKKQREYLARHVLQEETANTSDAMS
jgi:hypothetical protein